MFSGFAGNATYFKKSNKKATAYTSGKRRRGGLVRKSRYAPTRRKVTRTGYGGTKRRRKSTSMKTLSKRVTKLSKAVDQSLATLTVRRLAAGQITASEGRSLSTHLPLSDQGRINDSLDAVEMWSPTSSTFVTQDLSDNTLGLQREFTCIYLSYTITLRNNRNVPVHVSLAIMTPKNDTSVTPTNAFLAGLSDLGGLPADGILTKWADSGVLRDLWVSRLKKKAVIMPGQSLTVHWKHGGFLYRIETAEADALAYRTANKAAACFIRVQGPHGHDSVVAGEMSTLEASVDYTTEVTRVWSYEAGQSIHRVKTQLDTFQPTGFTNTGLVGQQPVANVQSF